MYLRSGRAFITLIALIVWLVVLTALGNAATPTPQHTYQNPPGPRIPDPYVLRASDGVYYAYGTTGFKAWSSKDLVKWQAEGNIYRKTNNSWGLGSFWAPEVVEYKGKFYLYYTADKVGSSKRIGVAVSDKPTGPFVDPYPHPLFDLGYGVIDPHVFIDDDGRKYLYYSRAMSEYEVSPGRFESHIYVIELGDDMISVKGEPILLTRPEQSWELQSGPRSYWNEGAAVFKRNGVYYLMWSANSYAGRRYAVGYATASSPVGPFTKWANNPILSADAWGARLSGPGHNSVIKSPDGSEWFIVYHTHIDPVQGGGPRQINIDRMGFRADGSIYVNGPTLTPQPTPAGNTELRNIAKDAEVSTSSLAQGYRAQAVIDGEIAFEPRFARYDWLSDGEGAGAWVQLTWAKERHIDTLYIYDSAHSSRMIKNGHVVFSNGTVVKDITFPAEPGAAAVVQAPNTGLTWVRFVVDELVNGDGAAALSEIMVMGHPLGEDVLGNAWISSPQPGSTLQTRTPLRIEGALPQGVTWSVMLDDTLIYQGDAYPSDLEFDAAALMPGWHTVQVSARSAAGATSLLTSSFQVQHMQVITPLDHEFLHGQATLSAAISLVPSDVERVIVSLTGGTETGQPVNRQLYAGAGLPPALPFDTLVYPDGDYVLRFEIWTKAGVHSTVDREVLIENWVALEDPLLPPTESGWFGLVERNLTIDRSAGWTHSTDNPEAFHGDADRLSRKQPTYEYLTWEHPRLHEFKITVFVQEPALTEQMVSISVSADGKNWVKAPYSTQTMGKGDSPWYKVELSGTTPDGMEASFIRLELAAVQELSERTDVQIGNLVLIGQTK